MTLLSLGGTSLDVLLLGVTLLVGFGSDWLAHRFRVPDVLWLIALGIVVGPVLGLLSPGPLLRFAPVLGVATLVLILFDAGLDLRVSLIRPLAGPALLFALASFLASTTVLFGLAYLWLFPGQVVLSLLFGTALGCTSGAVIIPLANRLRVPPGLRSVVQLESAVEDALAAISVTMILALLAPSTPSFALNVTAAILLPLPVGVAFGFVAGILWLFFLYEWQDRPFAALATLGALFVLYAGTEALGGSGILAALVFGGVLGNELLVRPWLRRTRPFEISAELRKVEVEIAFVLRAFFLFLIGLFVSLAYPGLLPGLVVVALVLGLYVLRRGLGVLAVASANLPLSWSSPLASLFGRGLTSAVLLVVAFQRIPAVAQLFLPALLVIVGTNIVMTLGMVVSPPAIERRAPETEQKWESISRELIALSLDDRPDLPNGPEAAAAPPPALPERPKSRP